MEFCWLLPHTFLYLCVSKLISDDFFLEMGATWVSRIIDGFIYIIAIHDDKGYTGILISLLTLKCESRILLTLLPINKIWQKVFSSYLLYEFLISDYLCIQKCHRRIYQCVQFFGAKIIFRVATITAAWWWVSYWSCLLPIEWIFVFLFGCFAPLNFFYHL